MIELKPILETCAAAGVEKVVAANHHGLLFLLSDGPEQRGGIVYKNSSILFDEMRELANTVNHILTPP